MSIGYHLRPSRFDAEHGTRRRYLRGCRCLPCRSANATYEAKRAADRAAGPSPPLVDAEPARSHLKALQGQQVGARQAAKLAGCSFSVIQAIRSGQHGQIKPSTHARIMAIPVLPADGVTVRAWQTKRWLRALEDEDFTIETLAERLRLPRLLDLSHTQRIKRATERIVGQFYQQQMAEAWAESPACGQ